jgi:LysM repeat protein
MKLSIEKKILKVDRRDFKIYFLFSFFFFLQLSFSYAQEKNSTPIAKTKSSATINGTHYYLHTVEKGQTLYAIAKFYGFDLNDLVIENPEAIDGIKPGQVLKIPFEKKKIVKKAEVDTSSYVLHTVEKGQTIYSITKQYNVTDEKLKVLNPELLNGLKTGQILKIPVDKPKTTAEIKSTAVVTNETKQHNKIEKIEYSETLRLTNAAEKISKTNFAGEKKEEYHIALFLPFHADEANALDIEKLLRGEAQLSNKTNVALQFYEGAMLAIDSLKKQKFNAKVFVYDVDDRDSNNIQNILKKPELKSMDLIIGPLYGTSFMPVAKFAKENEIAIVSPFTQINKILFNNPFVCKISPSTALQMEQMATYVVDSFKTQNIILINTTSAYNKDELYYSAFKTTANGLLRANGINDTIKETKTITGVQSLLSTTKTNVVVLPSTNQSFTTDFISKLNTFREKNKIVLFGMQAWTGYDNLDFEYLNNLSVHVPANGFVDYEKDATKTILKTYREKYKTEPDMVVFQSFDACYYFMSMLQTYGTGFLNNISEVEYKGVQANFLLSQYMADNSGFENKDIFILKYQDFKLVKAAK